ncbi:MAG: choice-of-anchor D domain-containing protein [Candidatus Cloacimonadaceae bacterium]|nr:choice-of-anchor D domain-containing protein [Candidatus Cloacimonadaceae bacterium]
MKKLLLILTLALVASFGFAAVITYNWAHSTAAYTEITGGTLLGGGSVDDTSYPNIALPFTFVYDGVSYTAFSVNANGFIALGTTIASSYTPISTGSTNNVISALGRDLKARTDGDLRWLVIGDPGSRELIVQWKNYARYQSTITVVDNFNFQIRLQEGTNKIFIHYGPFTVDALDMFSYPEVGIRGASTSDYKNRTTASNWAATSPGATNAAKCNLLNTVFPGSGTQYAFTPATAGIPPFPAELVSPANGTILLTGGNLVWAANGGDITGYKLYFGTDGGGVTSPGNIVSGNNLGLVTSYTPVGLAYGTTHYWQIVPTHTTNGDATGSPIWSFVSGTPLTGTKTIAPAGGDYASFTAAINALNNSGVGTGGVTFQVANGTYAENPPAITASGSATNPVIFQATPGAEPVLTPAGGVNTFGIRFDGADFVTFNNIDITGPNTLVYGYWLSNGAQNISILNCDINIPYSATTNYGIYSLGITGNPNSNLIATGNRIIGPYNPIYVTGSSTAGSEATGVVIQQNILTDVRNYAIYFGNGLNGLINQNQISFFNAATSTFYGIYVVGATTTCVISENTISGGYTSSTIYALYQASGTCTWQQNLVTNLYNTSSSGWYGFYATGGVSTWQHNSIYGITNTGTASLFAAYISTGNHDFIRNNFYDIATGGTSLYGIYVIGGTTHNINGNKVYNIRYTGTAGGIIYGIHLGSGTTNNIYNNMIYDLRNPGGTTAPQVRAISITAGTTDNIWYNTVYLNASGTNANFATAALYMTGGTTVDMKNNIFVNVSTPGSTGRSVAFWKTVSGFANISAGTDKNIYWTGATPGALNPICYNATTTYATMGEYKAAIATRDQGSYSENVPFISATAPYDLHINPSVPTRVEGNAIPIAGITFDIDNQARHATMPDIGADEGNFTPVAGAPVPAIAVNPINGAVMVPINAILQWSASDSGGTPTGYQVYFGDTNPPSFIQNQAAATYTPTLAYSRTYYWQIIPFNGDGVAVGTQVWSFTTQPDPRVNLPYSENFDGPPPNLAINPANSWVVGTPAKTYLNSAYSAPNALVTRSLTAAYNVSEDMSATLQINTSPLERAINVEFKQKFYSEANYDAMVLEYSIDNQATWTKWDPVLGTGANWDTATSTFWYNTNETWGPIPPPKWSGNNSSTLYAGHINGWLPTTTTIPYSVFGAAGNLSLRWRFASDTSVQYEGFAIDDIYIWQTPPTTIPPDPVVMVSPANNATNVDPRTVVLDWNPAATGGAVQTYDLYIGNDDDPYGSYYFAVTAPISQFSPFADGSVVLDYNSRWYWTVQPVNTAGFPEIDDCETWSFTTRPQMTSPATHNVGNVWPGGSKMGTIPVQNLGATAITFNVTGSPEFVFPAGPFSVPANSTYNLPYTFNAPAAIGPYTGSITLTQATPSVSIVNITVSATISTDVVIGNGTTDLMLPVYVYYGYTYSQTIYYPGELNWPAGYRIEKVYYYFNGAATSPNTQSYKIYMGHTTASAFATTTSWIPLSSLTMVYDNNNIPQVMPGGYWMEFVLSTPFIYNGIDNLVIAVDENFPGYDGSASFFHGTNTVTNRSIRYYDDYTNPDPAAPPTGTLVAGIPNTKLFVAPLPVNPMFSITPTSHNFGQLFTTNAPVTQNFTITNAGAGSLGITSINYAGAGAFTLVNVPTMPFFLSAGQSAVFGVQFNPAVEGSFTGTVSIQDNLSREIHTVAISGSSVDISGGYRVANSFQTTAPSYPTYNWIDVSATGTEVIGLTDDSFTATPIPLGMTFPFFGTDMTSVYVSSNGFLSFGEGSSSLSNTNIPNSGVPNNIIAFFWDDMNPNSSTVLDDWIKYQTVGGNFVITFHKLPRFGGDINSWLTAQVILYPSGQIKVQYAGMGSTLPMTGFTAGIENSTGLIGVQYQFDGVGQAIFGPAGEPMAVAYGQGDLSDPIITLTAPEITGIMPAGANVEIVWNAVAGAAGYKVYGSNDPYAVMPWTLVTTVPASENLALVPMTAAYKFYYVTAYAGTREEQQVPFRTLRK